MGAVAADRVSLREISRANVRAVCEVKLADTQRGLVSPASFTVAEGLFEPGAILRAIYLDETVVGVVHSDIEPDTRVSFISRFMIDAAQQGQGVGRHAIELLADEMLTLGATVIEACVVPRDDNAKGFWLSCGFADAGRQYDDEPVVARPLSAPV